MCLVDLHLRTTASDGTLTLDAVFKYVRRCGIALFSVADRDLPQSIDVPADLADHYVPGICARAEIDGRPLDLLIYGSVHPQSRLAAALTNQRIARMERVRDTLFRLLSEKIIITMEDVLGEAGAACCSITRFHLAKTLVSKGVSRSVRAAFNDFLAPGRPCHIPFRRINALSLIDLAHEDGAIVVAAEPLRSAEGLDLAALCRMGIDGIEARHISIRDEQRRRLEHYAKMHAFMITGGSHCRERTVPAPVELPSAFVTELRRYTLRLAG